MAFDIQSIIDSLKQLGNWGDSSGNQTQNNGAQAFAAPNSSWSPTQGTGPTLGSLAGNSLTEGVNANYGGSGFGGSSNGLGMNLGTAQLGLGGLSAISNIFNGIQGNKLARDQFKFTKDITNTNLNNQIQSYNTALGDRINSRAFTQGESSGWAQDYLDKNRLSR